MNLENDKNNFQLPRQLQKEGFGFIKLPPKSKDPFEKEWQKNPYNLAEIAGWINAGKNYGVAGGHGDLIIVDADRAEIREIIEAKLPPTFTVRSSGIKRHFYYLCSGIKSKIVLKTSKNKEDHYGEIISFGSQVVGPGSIHPKTNEPYAVVNDIEIASALKEDIFSALADYIPADNFVKKDYEVEENNNLNVVDVLQKFGVATNYAGKQLQIPHPIHGSKNGGNFVANAEKNVWYCFRCETGGGAINLIAVLEGIIDCSQAVSGGLKGEDYKKTIKIAEEKYGLKQDASPKDKENQANQVIKLLEEEKIEFFHDQYQEPHAALSENGLKILKLRSKNFKRWLAHLVYKKIKVALNSNSIQNVLQILEGKAIFENPCHELNVRVALYEDSIWYDLGDGSCVQINKEGWKIVEQPPILFYRFSHQKSQVKPEHGGRLTDIHQFFNLKNKDDQILLEVMIVSSFIPDFPHPISVIYGPQGSAKSTFQHLEKRLVDPSQIETLPPPKNLAELSQIASHHWVILFDNLSYMPEWLSDAFCRICTGDSFSKRELFSDDDDVLSSFRRVVGFNGINLLASKPDLLDRSILLGLNTIPRENKKKEKDIFGEFDKIKPFLLGSIFDILVKALIEKDKVNLPGTPRMVDFTYWGVAIARALNYTDEVFLKAYDANIRQQHDEAIDASLIAPVVINFMENKERWEGTASDLLADLKIVAEQLKIDTKNKHWPQEANWVWRRINEIAINLEAKGLKVSKGKSGNRHIVIEKINENGVQAVPTVQTGGEKTASADSTDSKDSISAI